MPVTMVTPDTYILLLQHVMIVCSELHRENWSFYSENNFVSHKLHFYTTEPQQQASSLGNKMDFVFYKLMKVQNMLKISENYGCEPGLWMLTWTLVKLHFFCSVLEWIIPLTWALEEIKWDESLTDLIKLMSAQWPLTSDRKLASFSLRSSTRVWRRYVINIWNSIQKTTNFNSDSEVFL